MFERFTDRARRVLNLAQEEARRLTHSFIGTEHILLGLIHEGEGVAAQALASLGVTLEAARQEVVEAVGATGTPPGGPPPFTPRAKKVLELSLREALQLGHSYIGTEHLLLGLVREGEGVGASVLQALGVDFLRVRSRVIQLMRGSLGEMITVVPSPEIQAARARRRPPMLDPTARRYAATGGRWSAEIVLAGRCPEDFATAYDQLAELASRIGLDGLDTSRLYLASIETDEGPGLRLSVTHDLPAPEEHEDTGEDADSGAGGPVPEESSSDPSEEGGSSRVEGAEDEERA